MFGVISTGFKGYIEKLQSKLNLDCTFDLPDISRRYFANQSEAALFADRR